MKYSRKDYTSNVCTHRQYYAQFVTEQIINIVKMNIGLKTILNSTDRHMNDIALSKWDYLHGIIAGANSLSDTVCIAKEAARQIRESNK